MQGDNLQTDLNKYSQVLLDLARNSIAAHLKQEKFSAPIVPEHINQPQGVFITLWSPDHQLRGCIGHIEPTASTLVEEIRSCAIAAATEDPRFPKVTEGELPELSLEISLLHPLQQVSDLSELDPATFGVVVQAGSRRGLLLPEVQGVDTAEKQVAIAMNKGGIDPSEAYELFRFRVTKLK